MFPAIVSAAALARLVEIQTARAFFGMPGLASGFRPSPCLVSGFRPSPANCHMLVAGGSGMTSGCRAVLGRRGGAGGGGGITAASAVRLPLLDADREMSVSECSVLVLPVWYSQHGSTM